VDDYCQHIDGRRPQEIGLRETGQIMPPRLLQPKRAPILLRLVAELKRTSRKRKIRKMQHLPLLDYSKSN
jgi:hypothetical protein